MDASSPALHPDRVEHPAEKVHILLRASPYGRCHGTLARETRPPLQLLAEAALHVGGDKKGEFRACLEFREIAGRAVDVSAEQDETAEPFPDKDRHCIAVCGLGQSASLDPRHHHLRNCLLQRWNFHGAILSFFQGQCKFFSPCLTSSAGKDMLILFPLYPA